MAEEQAIGNRILRGIRVPKDDDVYEQTMSVKQVVPPNGWLPVFLETRGINMLEKEFTKKHKDIPPSVLKKRPRYKIEPKIDRAMEQLFRSVIRPRQTILDSEEVALKQMKMQAGISDRGPFTLPMQDSYLDGVYNTAKASEMQAMMLQNSGVGQPMLGFQPAGAPVPVVIAGAPDAGAGAVDAAPEAYAARGGRGLMSKGPARGGYAASITGDIPLEIDPRQIKLTIGGAGRTIDLNIANQDQLKFQGTVDMNGRPVNVNLKNLDKANYQANDAVDMRGRKIGMGTRNVDQAQLQIDEPLDLTNQRIKMNVANAQGAQLEGIQEYNADGQTIGVKMRGAPKLRDISLDGEYNVGVKKGQNFRLRPEADLALEGDIPIKVDTRKARFQPVGDIQLEGDYQVPVRAGPNFRARAGEVTLDELLVDKLDVRGARYAGEAPVVNMPPLEYKIRENSKNKKVIAYDMVEPELRVNLLKNQANAPTIPVQLTEPQMQYSVIRNPLNVEKLPERVIQDPEVIYSFTANPNNKKVINRTFAEPLIDYQFEENKANVKQLTRNMLDPQVEYKSQLNPANKTQIDRILTDPLVNYQQVANENNPLQLQRQIMDPKMMYDIKENPGNVKEIQRQIMEPKLNVSVGAREDNAKPISRLIVDPPVNYTMLANENNRKSLSRIIEDPKVNYQLQPNPANATQIERVVPEAPVPLSMIALQQNARPEQLKSAMRQPEAQMQQPVLPTQLSQTAPAIVDKGAKAEEVKMSAPQPRRFAGDEQTAQRQKNFMGAGARSPAPMDVSRTIQLRRQSARREFISQARSSSVSSNPTSKSSVEDMPGDLTKSPAARLSDVDSTFAEELQEQDEDAIVLGQTADANYPAVDSDVRSGRANNPTMTELQNVQKATGPYLQALAKYTVAMRKYTQFGDAQIQKALTAQVVDLIKGLGSSKAAEYYFNTDPVGKAFLKADIEDPVFGTDRDVKPGTLSSIGGKFGAFNQYLIDQNKTTAFQRENWAKGLYLKKKSLDYGSTTADKDPKAEIVKKTLKYDALRAEVESLRKAEITALEAQNAPVEQIEKKEEKIVEIRQQQKKLQKVAEKKGSMSEEYKTQLKLQLAYMMKQREKLAKKIEQKNVRNTTKSIMARAADSIKRDYRTQMERTIPMSKTQQRRMASIMREDDGDTGMGDYGSSSYRKRAMREASRSGTRPGILSRVSFGQSAVRTFDGGEEPAAVSQTRRTSLFL